MHYRAFILRVFPKFLWRGLREIYFRARLFPCAVYDFNRFVAHSGVNKSKGQFSQVSARITLIYHQIEKGLSLRNPRPGFGVDPIKQLLELMREFVSAYGLIAPATTALAVLESYVEFNKSVGCDVSWLIVDLKRLKDSFGIKEIEPTKWPGGVVKLTRAQLYEEKSRDFPRFFQSRYSIRQFGGDPIALDDLKEVIRIAQKTPSVCNRQSWRAHVYTSPEKVERLLEIQACSRGFGDKAAAVIVVTAELGAFVDAAERYQPWIDGGMFAMSVCLGLHHLGLGSCCLNWSKERDVDLLFRRESGIPDSENLIMLIAVGSLLDEFVVANSYRPPVESCMVIH